MCCQAVPASRPAARCSTLRWPAVPRRSRSRSSELQPGARADIVTLDTTHPSLAGRSSDTVLDGWIFAAGPGAVASVWAGGNKVVEGGRHRLRQNARDAFNATVRRLVA